MPYRDDDRDDRRLVYHATDSPFETQCFFGHIHFALRKDVHPVAGGQLLDAEIHRRLINATATNYWYAFACGLHGKRLNGFINVRLIYN